MIETVKCPACEGEMERGAVQIRDRDIGMSDDGLFFRPEAGNKWTEFLMPKVSKEAHYCPTCDAVFVGPTHTDVWNCAKCNEKVPVNFELCWNCSTPRPSAD